jgi:preprotein translocase subunit YajC
MMGPARMTHLLATLPQAASPGSSGGGGGGAIPFLVLIGIFAVVYLMFLRPANRRRRAAAGARSQASVGDLVTTTAGLIATVVAVSDDEVTLEVAPGVHSRYLPQAIVRVLEEAEPDEAGAEHDTESTETDSPDDAEPHSAAVDEPNDT